MRARPEAIRRGRRRRADRLDVFQRQQLAVRRKGRQVSHLAPDSRAADARARVERRAARRRYGIARHVRSARAAASCISPSSSRRCAAKATSSRSPSRRSSSPSATASAGSRSNTSSSTCPKSTPGAAIEALGRRKAIDVEHARPSTTVSGSNTPCRRARSSDCAASS